jgi:putative oxidoreductase
MTVQAVTILAVRCGLVVLFFPASALDKVMDFQGAVAQASEVFKPRLIAIGTILAGLTIETLMPIGILTGVCDHLAALVLAGYSVVTAVLFKRFWQATDFWKRGQSEGRNLFWDFLKNLSLASGFLLITFGVDGTGLRPFLANPLASSHPYAASGHHGA